jgi:hypothetical protein
MYLWCLVAALGVGMVFISGAQAVHETGIFQLDGNAQTTVQSSPTAREDWDQVCSALLTTLTPPGTCPGATNYPFPTYGTLSAAIDASQVSITVTQTTTPPAVPFIIRINSEEMRVTAVASGVYTVVRGYNSASGSSPRGGPAASHVSGSTVFAITIGSPVSFVVDPSQSATDDILKGGTKDDNPVSSWAWTSAKPSPPKNDITDAYAAEYTCGGNLPNSVPNCDSRHLNHKILYFGGDRFSNSGSANLAFWFFQKRVRQLQADGVTPVGTAGVDTCSLSSGCLFQDEHVAGTFNPDGTVNTPGDILIISAFGPHAALQVYMWVGVGNAPSPCFTNACSLVPLIPVSAGVECGANSVTVDDACAKVNVGGELSPWSLAQKGAPADHFDATNFFEGGIDLNQLGLTGACFSTFLMNTRASAAGDAELHDKIMGSFQHCAPSMGTQASTNGEVTPGTAVTDRATVTVGGATNPADATGTVKFFLCKVALPDFCTTGGNQIGTTGVDAERPLTNANCSPVSPSSTDGISCAVSLTVNDSGQTGNRGSLAPGRYCFRAEATTTNYDSPDPFSDAASECFTVAKTPTTISTAQNWLPQDTATVTAGVVGKVTFTLYNSADCTGTVLGTFTDPSGADATHASPFASNNATTYASPGKTLSWSAHFDPDDTTTYLSSNVTRCEKSVLTIDDSASVFPPGP